MTRINPICSYETRPPDWTAPKYLKRLKTPRATRAMCFQLETLQEGRPEKALKGT